MPHLCMIFEATGPFNAIGRIAMAEVEAALGAGWNVSVVANRLGESLQGRVEWLKLYNPPRGFAVKWLTARHFIKKTMGDPARFDVIHGHQPQVADLCDIFECHYLTRAAMERGCRDARSGWRGRLARIQEQIVLRAEDRCFRGWNSQTWLICDSELTRREFTRLYGRPASVSVQVYPAPSWNPPTLAERQQARRDLVGDWHGPVVGFLGGNSERKGCGAILRGAAESSGLFLLLGGQHGQTVQPPPELVNRFRGMGLVDDVNRFYAAIDVLAVPSVFEPFGLVCFEAAARGVPVIATDSVGALQTLEPFGVSRRWAVAEPLEPIVGELAATSATVAERCRALVEEHSQENFAAHAISAYERVLTRKGKGSDGSEMRQTNPRGASRSELTS